MKDKNEYNQAVEHFNSLPHTFNTVSNGKVANTYKKADNAHKDGTELNTFIIDEETSYTTKED